MTNFLYFRFRRSVKMCSDNLEIAKTLVAKLTQQNETLEAENLVLKGEIQKLRQIIYDQQADEK